LNGIRNRIVFVNSRFL